jgi:hypothetical protein
MLFSRFNDQGWPLMHQLTNANMNRYRFQAIHSGNHCGCRFEGAALGAGNSIHKGVIFLSDTTAFLYFSCI